MVRNKKGFSLAEAIISMLIITIVAVGSLPILTKSKARVESITLRGQFGCWVYRHIDGITPDGWDDLDGKLVQWQFKEREPLTARPEEAPLLPIDPSDEREISTIPDDEKMRQCKMFLDNRPGHFYLIASGAGSDNASGQVKVAYTNELSNNSYITIGRHENDASTPDIDEGQETMVSGTNISANGPMTNLPSGYNAKTDIHGINPTNIKSCRLLSDNTTNLFDGAQMLCRTAGARTGDPKARSCELVYEREYDHINGIYKDKPKIVINGCEMTDESGNNVLEAIDFEHISPMNFTLPAGEKNLDSTGEDTIKNLSTAHNRYYSGNVLDNGGNIVRTYNFILDFYDSEYAPFKNVMGLTNADRTDVGHTAGEKISKMARLINLISVRRNTELTRILKASNPGAIGNNGAVLILW